MTPKGQAEATIEMILALEEQEKGMRRLNAKLADDLVALSVSLRDELADFLVHQAIAEYVNRPHEMPAKDVAILELDGLYEKVKTVGMLPRDGDGIKREPLAALVKQVRDKVKDAP